jgi:predicted RNase H-like HicB family nuclease
MAVHDEVLAASRRLCRERRDWSFTVEEVVRALPHLNEHSVRTHVGSRCCVNAPRHHPHRWNYFRRVGRGRYEILEPYRREPSGTDPPSRRGAAHAQVAESSARYGAQPIGSAVGAIHAVVRRDGRLYVAECLEVAVVTQGKSLDDVLTNLREAIALHLEGEDRRSLGLSRRPRLVLTYEGPTDLHEEA